MAEDVEISTVYPAYGLPWDHPAANPLADIRQVIADRGLPKMQPFQEDIALAAALGKPIELRKGRKW